MADLTLNINGNASGASAALRDAGGAVSDLGDDVGKSVVKWQELANITKQAISAVVKFGVDAVRAYAEAERVQKQLTRVAGQYAEALGEQAEAMSRVYAVDDDIIKQSQTLMVQWGGVGAATEATTKAILDYAAATGQDATAATQDLIRNVESGGVGLAKMGVHFKATGDKGKDLAAAVEALNKKFGGAAKTNANTLEGSLTAAGLAFEDFKKAIGQAIGDMIQASGIVPTLTKQIRELKDSLFTPTMAKQAESQEFIQQQVTYWEDILAGHVKGYKDYEKGIEFTFEEAQAEWAKWRAKLTSEQKQGVFAAGGKPTVTGLTNRGGKDAEAQAEKMKAIREKNLEDTRAYFKRDEELADQAAAEQQQSYADELNNTANFVKDRLKLDEETAKAREQIRIEDEKRAAESAERQAKHAAEVQERSIKEEKERMDKREAQAKSAGDAIGAAFVNSMAEQLSKLAEGGEFDAALFIGDVLASIVGVAAGIIGTAYGMPQVGAAIGNLAGMGIRAGFGAVSSQRRKARTTKQYHSGGWVGDEAELPRFHTGAWIRGDEQAAILQTGERVLSRTEVSRMGGPGGVDAAAKGRGGITVNVNAIDTKSAAESFTEGLGRGMRLALKSGRGDLPGLIGMGAR